MYCVTFSSLNTENTGKHFANSICCWGKTAFLCMYICINVYFVCVCVLNRQRKLFPYSLPKYGPNSYVKKLPRILLMFSNRKARGLQRLRVKTISFTILSYVNRTFYKCIPKGKHHLATPYFTYFSEEPLETTDRKLYK